MEDRDDPYADPEVEARWFAEQRNDVLDYLMQEGVSHGGVPEAPAWSASPYVSVWRVGSVKTPATVGWWAICGDCPCDYVSAADASNPREAIKAIASLWQEKAAFMARGETHPTFVIGLGESDEELAPLLSSRAELLLEWVEDDDAWGDES
ncbi:hypothetical protein GCM10008098_28590 [Rhodanobacter panaciterrae]|uniref:DUF4826 family protein n=1 Tax=Rhodanobacter panaciterrae TaxID=490572 RepID=A0ABQ3A555_9GAMM|nr:DUF4826 family protein [Rhodanobacter panaciterrae]GGY33539.1 hypothetical protein GCM10008098_28590 [Rhodanobacter panaciterrae]